MRSFKLNLHALREPRLLTLVPLLDWSLDIDAATAAFGGFLSLPELFYLASAIYGLVATI